MCVFHLYFGRYVKLLNIVTIIDNCKVIILTKKINDIFFEIVRKYLINIFYWNLYWT